MPLNLHKLIANNAYGKRSNDVKLAALLLIHHHFKIVPNLSHLYGLDHLSESDIRYKTIISIVVLSFIIKKGI